MSESGHEKEAHTPFTEEDPDEGRASTEFSEDTGGTVRRGVTGFVVLLVVAFSVVAVKRWHDAHHLRAESAAEVKQKIAVDVVTVKGTPHGAQLTLPGETASWYEATIYGRVDGYVAKWWSDIGDHVRKGQVLALIDTPELDAQLAAARARVHADKAIVRVRKAEEEFATTTYIRWRDAPKGVVSVQDREEKKADYVSAKARLNAARAQVALAQADVNHYSALTTFKKVTAPFTGTVVAREIDVGNLVTAGSTASTTPLYRISQDNPMRIFVDAPQAVANDLRHPGTPVTIRANDLPGKLFHGTVTRTAQAIDPDARTLKVEIDLRNLSHVLIPGMYVDVRFNLPNNGLFQVPAAAMVFESSGPHVAVVDANGVVHFRRVTIARDEGNVLDLSSGVHPGDRVALNISSQIADGESVIANDVGSEK